MVTSKIKNVVKTGWDVTFRDLVLHRKTPTVAHDQITNIFDQIKKLIIYNGRTSAQMATDFRDAGNYVANYIRDRSALLNGAGEFLMKSKLINNERNQPTIVEIEWGTSNDSQTYYSNFTE